METGGSSSGHSTWRERERRRCKKEILAAAAELFARFGYERTSMKRIAERAELSVGKLYNHFEGKEEIFREIMQIQLEELHKRGDEACNPLDPPLQQIRSRIDAAVEHFREHRDFMIIYHNENPMNLEGTIRENMRKNREIVTGLFASAIERGDIRGEESPLVLAAVLIGAVHRLMDLMVEGEEEDAFEAIPGIIDRIILNPLERAQKGASGTEGS
jgi:TetR/AcrR family transcriptional regulator